VSERRDLERRRGLASIGLRVVIFTVQMITKAA
jgi:hypothetical protein